jgi:hypothetical protein
MARTASKMAPKPRLLAQLLAAARTACAEHGLDALFIGGGACVVVGAAQIYGPAGWIVAGGLILRGCWLYAEGREPSPGGDGDIDDDPDED